MTRVELEPPASGEPAARRSTRMTTGQLVAQFNEWLEAAREAGEDEPTAMSLATTDTTGRPDVRVVLLKHADARGFVFYTNLESVKAAELRERPAAALCWYWGATKRQVRVAGTVERVSDAEADVHFATRPRLSQIGAWASRQSRPLADRLELERECAKVALRFVIGPIPRPPWWSGFRVVPRQIECWSGQAFRLHDRVRWVRCPASRGDDGELKDTADEQIWSGQRLFP